jgi:hypothetical protein
MKRPRLFLVTFLLGLGGLVACGAAEGPFVTGDVHADVPDVPAELPGEDADAPVDIGGTDTGADAFRFPSCQTDEDCEPNQYCRSGYSGRECLPTCLTQDYCPQGYFCRGMGGLEGTVVFACQPDLPQVCLPCASDDQCNDGTCIPIDGQSRCATFCTGAGGCPDGYACGDLGAVDPARPELGRCLPVSGSCECHAGTAGQKRPCFRQGPDGTCRGYETCDPSAGWTECDAPEPAEEVCDGADNDCDGAIDEGLPERIDCEQTEPGIGTCTGQAVCAGRDGWRCDAPIPAVETCDHRDNDCDGLTDEDFRIDDVYAMDAHCGNCGVACEGTIAHGTAFCDASLGTPICAVKTCDPGYFPVGRVLCVPADVPRCQPCSADVHCAGGVCLDMAGSGFCTSPCTGPEHCEDEGYDCVEKRDPEGNVLGSFCLPPNGSCDCTPALAGQVQSCAHTNAHGTCFGSHTCDPDLGWVGCTAAIPAAEVCDGLDNDCDGSADDGLADGAPCEREVAGVGTCTGTAVCRGTQGWVCDARTPTAEVCDGLDNDCDGEVDEADALGCLVRYPDEDGDGFGLTSGAACLCAADAGHPVRVGGDCDDTRPAVHPGAVETCGGLDDDCDGLTDEDGPVGCAPHYLDGDGDGFGSAGPGKCLCGPSAPYLAPALGDCDDDDAGRHPGAVESCNGIDDDCDGAVDEDGATGCTAWYRDLDGDGWGQDGTQRCLCAPQPPYTMASGGDCDDQIAAIHPGADERCNLFDDDCDGEVDEDATDCQVFFRDEDGDGFGIAGDTRCLCLPAAPYQAVVDGDCDDGAAAVRPVAEEVCNGIDDNCDGFTDAVPDLPGCTWFHVDADGDGYGLDAGRVCACEAPPGHPAAVGGDCDDGNGDVNPGVTDDCNGIDDDCDGATDEDAPDLDGDGVADCVDPCPIVVDAAAAPGGDGSVAAPFASVQAGIEHAAACGEVWVLPGTYFERLDFGGRGVRVVATAGPAVTTLDAAGTGSVVTFASGESAAAGLEGFTVRGGQGTTGVAPWGDPARTYGGGILVVGASPSLIDCVVTGNAVTGQGGGVFFFESAGVFADGVVQGNASTADGDAGAGIAMVSSSVDVFDALVRDNTAASGAGGGVLALVSGGSLRYSRILRNTAAAGAGIRLSGRVTTVVDGNVIGDNQGDGVSFQDYSSARFIQNTVVGNTGHGLRIALCCGATFSVPLIKNTVIAYNDGNGIRTDYNVDFGLFFTDTFSNSGGNYGGVMGSLGNSSLGITSRDCRFRTWSDDGNPDNDDLALRSDSPCIDSGGDVTLYGVTRDIAGASRPVNGTGGAYAQYDRGAYEYQQ